MQQGSMPRNQFLEYYLQKKHTYVLANLQQLANECTHSIQR